MKNSFFPVLGVLSLASAVVCSASPVWETDWSKALEKAGLTIGDLFRQVVGTYPDRIALRDRHHALTYVALAGRVARLVRALAPEQIGQNAGSVHRLAAPFCVQRNVLCALEPSERIPFGFAVAEDPGVERGVAEEA